MFTYRNSRYDMHGCWDEESGAVNVWFPVSESSKSAQVTFLERRDALLGRLAKVVDEPTADLIHSSDIDTTAPEDKSQENIELSSNVFVVNARLLSEMGVNALASCGTIIEDVYSDQMYARAQKALPSR